MLATAAETVRVWDASTFDEPLQEHTIHGDSIVRCVRWNHNVCAARAREREKGDGALRTLDV